jgi:hypothetical protein
MRRFILSTVLCAVALGAGPASAKKNKVKHLDLSTCPYSGLPEIDAFVGNHITIAETKFNLGRGAHSRAFQELLVVCNAAPALPPFQEWRMAHTLVVAKSAEAAAYAISATTRAMNVETEREKQVIIKDATDAAARFAAELVPLATNAGAKKQVFQATLMACVAP